MDGKNLHQEMLNLAGHVEQAHIDFLAKSVIPQGTVHFADTYGISNENPLYNFRQFHDTIDAKFKENHTVLWDFDQNPKLQFNVVSYRLEPKSEE